MRLPWLQVEQDGLTKCRLLARLLEVPETQGIGIGMAAWQWALEVAPDGDFDGDIPGPEMLAAATGWPVSDAARLVCEMQRVGLLATAPTLRIRGLDRYRRAWEKNQRKPSKSADSGSRVPETGTNPAPTRAVPARQTQTQTHKEKTVAPERPAPPREWQMLVDRLVQASPGYAFGGRDAKAVKGCLDKAKGDGEEVVVRWCRALARTGYPLVRALPELEAHWNHFADTDKTSKYHPDGFPKARRLG